MEKRRSPADDDGASETLVVNREKEIEQIGNSAERKLGRRKLYFNGQRFRLCVHAHDIDTAIDRACLIILIISQCRCGLSVAVAADERVEDTESAVEGLFYSSYYATRKWGLFMGLKEGEGCVIQGADWCYKRPKEWFFL